MAYTSVEAFGMFMLLGENVRRLRGQLEVKDLPTGLEPKNHLAQKSLAKLTIFTLSRFAYFAQEKMNEGLDFFNDALWFDDVTFISNCEVNHHNRCWSFENRTGYVQ
ncbi:hypothetical protein J6590_026333 [Homalodisca vitripennis]|nr:hypothetical protein J6590_026333 [Homalodisca vitripennis]